MSSMQDYKPNLKYPKFVISVAVATATMSILVMLGWLFHFKPLTSVLPGLPTMKFNTALSFMLVSFSLLLKAKKSNPTKDLVANLLAGLGLIVAFLTLLEHLFGASLGIDEFFIIDNYSTATSTVGRMSLATSLCFLLINIVLLLNKHKSNFIVGLRQIALYIATIISFIVLVNYFFGIPIRQRAEIVSSMAIHTAFSFFALSSAITFFNPDKGLVNLFIGNRISNIMARKLLLQITVSILLITFIRIILARYKIVSEEFGITVLGVSCVLACILIIAAATKSMSKMEDERLKAEGQLKNSLVFINEAPSAIALFDNNMCYLAASKQWLIDYQLEDIDIIGKSHYEFFPEIGDDWKKIHQECLNGAVNKCDEAVFKRKDGSTQWISWDVRPWRDNHNQIGGIIMNTNNITEFKQSIYERLELEKILNKANEIARIGSWEVDLKSQQVKWSKITREIHEMPDDFDPKLDQAIEFYVPGKSRDRIQNAVDEAISLGKAWDLEIQLISGKGRKIWTRSIGQAEFVDGKCVRIFGIFQDIDKIKSTENNLLKANQQLSAILNSGYVSIIGTDTEGVITYFSPGAERLLQYSAENLIGKESPALFHLEEEIIARGIELTKELRKPIEGFNVFTSIPDKNDVEAREWTYVRKDGSTFPVQLVVTPIYKEQKILDGYLGVAFDLSEIHDAQKEIKSLLDITTDQNNRLKNFAHIVSHNLRSHSGNFEMLLHIFSSLYPDMESDEIVTQLHSASENLKETIAHLNEVVQINNTLESSLSHLNLRNFIQSAINNVSSLAKDAQVKIEHNVDPEIEVFGMHAYLDSVLLNLITNGIKYRSKDRAAKLMLKAENLGKYILLKVSDNGLGIDMKRNGARVFGMYKTFHDNKDARGIGLFITKNQIESMGGKIEVESKVNVGTTFKISLINAKS